MFQIVTVLTLKCCAVQYGYEWIKPDSKYRMKLVAKCSDGIRHNWARFSFLLIKTTLTWHDIVLRKSYQSHLFVLLYRWIMAMTCPLETLLPPMSVALSISRPRPSRIKTEIEHNRRDGDLNREVWNLKKSKQKTAENHTPALRYELLIRNRMKMSRSHNRNKNALLSKKILLIQLNNLNK